MFRTSILIFLGGISVGSAVGIPLLKERKKLENKLEELVIEDENLSEKLRVTKEEVYFYKYKSHITEGEINYLKRQGNLPRVTTGFDECSRIDKAWAQRILNGKSPESTGDSFMAFRNCWIHISEV